MGQTIVVEVYALQARRARQAWHSLDTRGGAQGVVPHRGLSVPRSRGVAGVALSPHRRGCAMGGPSP
eukprot:7911433-Pyramimonas_sp.AAC.1